MDWIQNILRKNNSSCGFTLTEMLVVITLIAVLATIVVPKMGMLLRQGNESSTLKKLTTIRSALNIYMNNNEGLSPPDLFPLLQPGNRYMSGEVPIYTRQHGKSTTIQYSPSIDGSADSGGLGYVTEGLDHGTIWIQCTHTDLKGKVWSNY